MWAEGKEAAQFFSWCTIAVLEAMVGERLWLGMEREYAHSEASEWTCQCSGRGRYTRRLSGVLDDLDQGVRVEVLTWKMKD